MSDKIYLNARFGYREDTLSNWQTHNPLLLRGEIALVREGENGNFVKIGDGIHLFNELPFTTLPKGEKGDKGADGINGNDGYTPIKGIDYFDGKDGLDGKDAVTDQGYSPESENAQSGVAVAEALADYVKNTDYATKNKAGVIKTYESDGLQLLNDGELKTYPADRAAIDAKIAYHAPITPYRLDYAIKSSLTTNTIPLTAEEQAAAQNWLGITDTLKAYDNSKNYEHIETIVTTEELSEIRRTEEPNGDSYRFSKMLFYFWFPKATGNGWLTINTGFAAPAIASALRTDRNTFVRGEMILDDTINKLTAYYNEDINSTGNFKQLVYDTEYDYLWTAYIQGSAPFPIGTKIEIYGVRYNEN